MCDGRRPFIGGEGEGVEQSPEGGVTLLQEDGTGIRDEWKSTDCNDVSSLGC